MREYHVPPYRRLYSRIAGDIKIDFGDWNESQGFCQNCAKIYGEKLEERQRIAEDILSALDQLAPLEKSCFVFYHYRGWKRDKIAERMHVDEEKVREALARASKSLLLRLRPHIGTNQRPVRIFR
jgi:RNA polymerase sigma factor (sigma-70 family)